MEWYSTKERSSERRCTRGTLRVRATKAAVAGYYSPECLPVLENSDGVEQKPSTLHLEPSDIGSFSLGDALKKLNTFSVNEIIRIKSDEQTASQIKKEFGLIQIADEKVIVIFPEFLNIISYLNFLFFSLKEPLGALPQSTKKIPVKLTFYSTRITSTIGSIRLNLCLPDGWRNTERSNPLLTKKLRPGY